MGVKIEGEGWREGEREGEGERKRGGRERERERERGWDRREINPHLWCWFKLPKDSMKLSIDGLNKLWDWCLLLAYSQESINKPCICYVNRECHFVVVVERLLQDPHIDRVMATLVGSRTPGDSTCIQDIILPSKQIRGIFVNDDKLCCDHFA